MPGGRSGSPTCDMLFPAVFFAQCPRPGVGTSARAHAFFRATSEIPNRGARIFNGSDQTSSYSSLRENPLPIVISKHLPWTSPQRRGVSRQRVSPMICRHRQGTSVSGVVSASSTPTSRNHNEIDPQATMVYAGGRPFVSQSTSHFLDCVGDMPLPPDVSPIWGHHVLEIPILVHTSRHDGVQTDVFGLFTTDSKRLLRKLVRSTP